MAEQWTEVKDRPIGRELERASLSWGVIFAGDLMAVLFYTILLALGLGIGGSSLKNMIQMGGGLGIGMGAGIWAVVSILISLFLGSYFSGRISGPISTRMGSIQGLVIAAIFFGFMLSQLGSVMGGLTRGVANTIGAVGSVASDVMSDPRVQDTLRGALNGLPLKSPPDVVLQGVATRLFRGDDVGARDYLANQAGITSAEADRRITQMKNDLQKILTDIGSSLAGAISTAGWTLFFALVFGTVASAVGGGIGTSAQLKRPLGPRDIETIRRGKAA